MIEREEGYVTCPYERSHRILESRLQFHLVKCSRNYPQTKFLVCPFNVTHKVSQTEMNCHTNYLCEDRRKLDTFVCKTTENVKPLFDIQKIDIPPSQDNWDNDGGPSYDPKVYCNSAPILLNVQGVKPSERKDFRCKERQRLQEILNGPKQPAQESLPQSSKNMSPPRMRLPNTRAKAVENANKGFEPPKQIQHDVCSQNEDNLISTPNNDNAKLNDGFVVPKYARGRGRGRSGC